MGLSVPFTVDLVGYFTRVAVLRGAGLEIRNGVVDNVEEKN